MATRSIEMRRLRVPLAVIQRLSAEDRYTYYVLGHMFNELMSMQKIVGFALPKHDDYRPARIRPEIAQAMFLFRIAASKIYEASLTLTNKEVSATLRASILPKMPDGKGRLKAVNASINSAEWLGNLRNGLGFHFPDFQRWQTVTTPDERWVDDEVFVGELSGNTFYDAADSVALHWMFQQAGESDVRTAAPQLLDKLIELLRLMTNFLEDALGAWIADVLLAGQGKPELVGKVLAPEHDRVSIPFWTTMRQAK